MRNLKAAKSKTIKVRMIRLKNGGNKRMSAYEERKYPRQDILDNLYTSSLAIVKEQSFMQNRLQTLESSGFKEFTMRELCDGFIEHIFGEHNQENTTEAHMKKLNNVLEKSFGAFTDAYESPMDQPIVEMKGEFSIDFSSLNSRKLVSKLTSGSNTIVTMFIGRYGKSTEVGPSLRLLGFLYCIQHDILPVVVNINGYGAIHHALCYKHGSLFCNLRWYSVKSEWAKLNANCPCILNHEYTLKSIKMIAEPNFLTDLKVDQMPENFPERCGLAKESNEITLGKNFVRANYQFLMGQSKDANPRESIARISVLS